MRDGFFVGDMGDGLIIGFLLLASVRTRCDNAISLCPQVLSTD